MFRMRYFVFFLLFGIACPAAVGATVYQLTPDDDWFGVLSGDRLKPGDEVVLAAGVYRDQRRLVIGHQGTAEQPVVIRADEGAQAVLHRPDARQNSINIIGAQHLILRGLEITGGSTGIRLMKSDTHPCKFVTIEAMHIHHVGGPAVTANSPGNAYEGLIFRRNHIHHTSGHGEGFYLGVNNNPDGSTAGYMFDSLVEGNYIHDLGGPNVSQGDGIEIKDGSYNNIVCDNVIHDTNYPGVLVYGTDGHAPNIVQRNVIWNSGDHGIQAAAEAIIRNNIVFHNRSSGIHSHAHQSARVGNLQILHNTVISNRPDGAGIYISASPEAPLAGPVVIANNAIYVPNGGLALR
ncbi:MAG TPA: right-handed parallel beta-helix repeat-containing protein, partial [Thermoguttaceae bacterium]|nr:right-handed parallel beta-helix repeat-containing protein [Thermoguttaceae bacterium]